jgi:hypothetical protein
VTPPTITNVCTPMIVVSPAANSFENGRSACTAMRNPLPMNKRKRMHTEAVPISPSLADGGEHEVGRRVGDLPRAAEAESGAGEATGSERNIDCTIWKPVVCDTDHGSTQAVTRSCTWPNNRYAITAPPTKPNATTRYEARFGGDVEHRREHGEEEERGTEVLLAHHHQDRHAPRERSSGLRCFGSGSASCPDVTGPR